MNLNLFKISLLWVWENCYDRKKFERDLEAKDPKLFQHFRVS